jgi:hypothetical protein
MRSGIHKDIAVVKNSIKNIELVRRSLATRNECVPCQAKLTQATKQLEQAMRLLEVELNERR